MTKELIDKLIAVAVSQIGVSEKGGNNKGPKIVEYQKATWLVPGAWSWCAAFCAWVLREWLRSPEVRAYFGIKEKDIEKWRCRGANTTDWLKWGIKMKWVVLYKPLQTKQLIKAGDIVIFDFQQDGKNDHIGFAIKDQMLITDDVQTIEGNTNAAGKADSTTGDKVTYKARKMPLISAIVRIV
jgi:hypothetical protein